MHSHSPWAWKSFCCTCRPESHAVRTIQNSMRTSICVLHAPLPRDSYSWHCPWDEMDPVLLVCSLHFPPSALLIYLAPQTRPWFIAGIYLRVPMIKVIFKRLSSHDLAVKVSLIRQIIWMTRRITWSRKKGCVGKMSWFFQLFRHDKTELSIFAFSSFL